MPPQTRWIADNFNHLLEQPMNFYAVVLALQYLGVQDPMTVGLAWGEYNLSNLVTTSGVGGGQGGKEDLTAC